MKKKGLILASAAIITAVSIGGYAFAQGADQELVNNQQQVEIKQSLETEDYNNNQSKVTSEKSVRPRNYNTHCWNDEEMIQTMKENGFEDMAKWMEDGDFEAMNEYMNNMTEEDYERMTDLMNQNGYGNMSRMMNSVGREDMVRMHNSMMGGRGNRFGRNNMMGRFQY